MRISLQLAFVLHRRPYRNTSLLLEVFGCETGRMGLVAHAAARPRSQLKGLLQPFAPLLLSWTGAGDLATLTAAEEANRPITLAPDRILAGLYANELLVRLLPRQDAQPNLFTAYQTLLVALAAAPCPEPALRCFEKRLLEELGYGLTLDREAASGLPINPGARYCYVLNQGPLPASEMPDGIMISGQSLLALRDDLPAAESSVLREVKRLTRAALAEQLRGRPLKTRELYRRKSAV